MLPPIIYKTVEESITGKKSKFFATSNMIYGRRLALNYFTSVCKRDGISDGETINSLIVRHLGSGEQLEMANNAIINRLWHAWKARSLRSCSTNKSRLWLIWRSSCGCPFTYPPFYPYSEGSPHTLDSQRKLNDIVSLQ